MVTLTLRSTKTDLRLELDRLYTAYKRLRGLTLWKRAIAAAVAVLELTYNAGTDQFHPHLHVLTVGNYISQAELATAWERLTGDSRIVHIKLIRNPRQAVQYVSKYVTKPLDSTCTRNDRILEEVVVALRGRKLLIATGHARTWRLTSPPDAGDWERWLYLAEVHVRADAGDPAMEQVITAVLRLKPNESEFTIPLALIP